MIRDITIGQYYPVDSIVHKLDPRVKLFGTFLFIISLFTFQQFAGFIVVISFMALLIHISKVPFRYIVRGLKAIVILLLFTGLFNLFLTPGTVLVQVWIFKITKEGIRMALFTSIRLILLILGSSMVTFTTTPNQLTDGIERLLEPFKKIKVPVHEIAMMMSIALRFIPILIEETDKIMKAQMARGADFESGGVIKKAKSMLPLLVPLFVSAFRRANELAMAMEARCYNGGDGRTKMKPLQYNKRDGVGYFFLGCYLVVLFTVNFLVKKYMV